MMYGKQKKIFTLALEEIFNGVGLKARAMMVMEVNSFADPYRIRDARRHLDEGEVVIIGGCHPTIQCRHYRLDHRRMPRTYLYDNPTH